jgi:hypothetical protein
MKLVKRHLYIALMHATICERELKGVKNMLELETDFHIP